MRWIEFTGWALNSGLLAVGLVLGGIWFTAGYLFGRRRHDVRCLPPMRVLYPAPHNVDPDELRRRIVAGRKPVRLSDR